MATVLHGWGYSTQNETRFDVYLDDGTAGGAGAEIELEALKHTYKSDQNDIDANLLLSRMEVTFLVDSANAAHESALANMAASAEGQFKLRVERDGTLDFIGFVQLEQLTVEDTAGRYQYTIKATDGIARLKSVDYEGGGPFYDDYATIKEHLLDIMSKVPSTGYFAAGSPYLDVNVDMWPEGLTPSNADDPFELIRFSYRAMRLVDDRGNIDFSSYYDVLLEICQAFGLRFMHSRGRYLLTSTIDYTRAAENVTFRRYDVAGTRISDQTVDYSTLTRQAGNNLQWHSLTGELITQSGGDITFLPALQKVEWTYQHYSRQNTLPTTSSWSHQSQPVVAIQNFRTAPGLQLSVRAAASATAVFDPVGQPVNLPDSTLWVVLGLRLTVDDGEGSIQSLRRTTTIVQGGVTNGEAEWVSGSSGIFAEFAIRPGPFSASFQIQTPPVPISGSLTMQFDLLRAVRNAQTWTGADAEWRVYNPFMETQIQGSVDDQYNFSNYRAINTAFAGNSASLERTVRLGDGPSENSFGRFEYFDGTVWQVTTGWQKWAAGAYVDNTPVSHGARRSQDVLFLQNEGRRILKRAMFVRDYAAEYLLSEASRRYLLYGGSFDLLNDRYQGEWREINYTPVIIAVPDEQTSNEGTSTGGITPDTTGSSSEGTVGTAGGGVGPVRTETPPAHVQVGLTTVDTNIESQIPQGSTGTSIPVQSTPVDLPLFEGDIIVITHPTTGEQLEVTVAYNSELGVPAADQLNPPPEAFPFFGPDGVVWLVPDDTNVAVESYTPDITFPADSFVQFNAAYLTRLRALLRIDHVDANLVGYETTLTTGFDDWFWRPGRRTGWHIRKVHFAFGQAGTGQAKVNLKYYDATGFRYTIATHDATGGLGSVQDAFATVQDGYYRVEVETLTATPPKGLTVTIEVIKILPNA